MPPTNFAYLCVDCPPGATERTLLSKVDAENHHDATNHRIAYLSLAFGKMGV